MKPALSMSMFLSFVLCVAVTVMAQDFASLLERAENTVKSKNPSLGPARKTQITDNEVVYRWGSPKDGVRLLIFYGASDQAAAEKMRISVDRISVGPDRKLTDLGDEALLWKGSASGSGVIRFRKSNLYFDLSTPSLAMAEDLAKSLANLIEGK